MKHRKMNWGRLGPPNIEPCQNCGCYYTTQDENCVYCGQRVYTTK